MRRRPKPDGDPTPLQLRRFAPAEWGDDEQAPVRWYAARAEYARQMGEPASEVEGIVWPDVPFDPGSL